MTLAMRPIDVQRRLTELGRIRLGEKGGKGEPRKLTKFRLTSASSRLLEGAAAVYGGQVRPWHGAPDEGYFELYTEASELDILIPPTLASYSQAYELWSGGGAVRRCDGKVETISGEACLCDPNDRTCQITTRVSVMLPRVPGLGVWRLDTKGWNAAATLPSTLELLSAAAGGGWVPAVLRAEQRTSKKKGQTRRFVVPVVDVATSIDQLIAGASQTALAAGVSGTLPALGSGASRSEKVARPALPPGPPLPEQASFSRDDAPPIPAPPAITVTTEDGASVDVATGEVHRALTPQELRAWRRERGVTDEYALSVGRLVFGPDFDPSQLSDGDRAQWRDAMENPPEEAA